MNHIWLRRLLRLAEPAPVERKEEAKKAQEEAKNRRVAATEVLLIREHVITVNHIAADIGKAYSLTRRGK